jgi:hypothetical protein
MSYIQDIERELRQLLRGGEPEEAIVAFVKQKLAHSYRNGLKAAGKEPAEKKARSEKLAK